LNIGDLLFQLMFYILLFGLFSAVFFVVTSLLKKKPDNQKSIEQKLDRIIELLEHDRRN
jgi:CBS domain containing-hemolysin-like protein